MDSKEVRFCQNRVCVQELHPLKLLNLSLRVLHIEAPSFHGISMVWYNPLPNTGLGRARSDSGDSEPERRRHVPSSKEDTTGRGSSPPVEVKTTTSGDTVSMSIEETK